MHTAKGEKNITYRMHSYKNLNTVVCADISFMLLKTILHVCKNARVTKIAHLTAHGNKKLLAQVHFSILYPTGKCPAKSPAKMSSEAVT